MPGCKLRRTYRVRPDYTDVGEPCPLNAHTAPPLLQRHCHCSTPLNPPVTSPDLGRFWVVVRELTDTGNSVYTNSELFRVGGHPGGEDGGALHMQRERRISSTQRRNSANLKICWTNKSAKKACGLCQSTPQLVADMEVAYSASPSRHARTQVPYDLVQQRYFRAACISDVSKNFYQYSS